MSSTSADHELPGSGVAPSPQSSVTLGPLDLKPPVMPARPFKGLDTVAVNGLKYFITITSHRSSTSVSNQWKTLGVWCLGIYRWHTGLINQFLLLLTMLSLLPWRLAGFLIVSAPWLIRADSSVNIALQASFDSPPYLLELL